MSDLYRVKTTFTASAGAPYLTTLIFEGDGTPSSAHAVAARGKVVAMWNSLVTSLHPSVTGSVDVTVDYLNEITGALITSFAVSPFTFTGTGTSEVLPPTVQGVCRHETGQIRNGRRVRGKTYIPGMQEIRNVGGFPDSTIIAAITTAFAQLYTPNTNPFFAVWHRPVNGAGGEAIVASGSNALSYWGSLRSRRDS